MVSFPPCKINLGLHVTGKRPDGYHNLETCFYPVPWTDILEIIPSNQFGFTSSGSVIPGDPEKNLCIKAYNLIRADHAIPAVKIHLHKIIPTGAGLGGGSSDGAFTLRVLNEMFGIELSVSVLMNYAAQLGSDCAFFINDKPMLGSGRGEILNDVRLSLEGKFLVIIKPDIHISTAEAYAGVTPGKPLVSLREIVEEIPVADWKNVLTNDFEKSILKKHPAIQSIKDKLYQMNAIYASMSGSGSAVFGIFENETKVPDEYRSVSWSGML